MRDSTLFEGCDRVLQILVSVVNKGGQELGITLNVGGLIVSGILISNKKYWEDSQPGLRDMLKESGEKVDPQDELYYIHLKDAMYFNAGEHPVPVGGMWWRGKINSVDGFSLARLAVEAEEQSDS